MNRPTDRRSIVTSLVWGILAMCVIGSPGDASGQIDETSVSPIVEVGSWVPVRDVEDLDTSTRLMWTLQMVFAPSALAHVSPFYAYDPSELVGRTVYPDRIGRVATVSTCDTTTMRPMPAPNNELTFTNFVDGYPGPQKPELSPDGVLSIPHTGNKFSWCANYGSDTADTFRSAHTLSFDENGQLRVYFATTYPLPDIEPKKRFVVGR